MPDHLFEETSSKFAGGGFRTLAYQNAQKYCSHQRILLAASLQKLDATESRQFRRRRKDYTSQHPLQSSRNSPTIQSIFFPDECYDFSEGHYDGVIKRYREMHVSSWPEDVPGLKEILDKIHAVHPTEPSQTHLLHLASDGEIFPHVDNLGASGSWILGSVYSKRLNQIRIQALSDKATRHAESGSKAQYDDQGPP
ncbi:hypothetical protein ABKN59_002503 [Abortiporus biennis]